jgi:hypothetical protein
LSETIFIIPLAVLAVFKFFGMDITPLVAIISSVAFIPLFILFYSESEKGGDKVSFKGGILIHVLTLIFGLFLGDTIKLPSISVNLKHALFTIIIFLLLVPLWFPFLRVKNALPELRAYIFTITPKDLKRKRDYTKLVGWFYPLDINEKKQARLLHQDSLQEDGDLNSKTDRKDFLETLGYIAYERLHKEFQDTYGIILEDKKEGLIYIRNKYRKGLTPEDRFRIFYYYFDWVQNKLNSFRSAQKDQKLTISSLGELDPDVLPDLLKMPFQSIVSFLIIKRCSIKKL